MTFGELKSFIEQTLTESYNVNKDKFKTSIKDFRQTLLINKSFTKLYSLYDQLSNPQGLSENDANLFINEGINMINNELKAIKIPKTNTLIKNHYSDIDNLVYNNTSNILERVNSRKKLLNILMSNQNILETKVNLPIKTTVNIANKILGNYVSNLDESSKRYILNLLSEDKTVLKEDYENIKHNLLKKLNVLLENESDIDTKKTITDTISKIHNENFDYLSYIKIKNLEESL